MYLVITNKLAFFFFLSVYASLQSDYMQWKKNGPTLPIIMDS